MARTDATGAQVAFWPFGAAAHAPPRPVAARLRDLAELTGEVADSLTRLVETERRAAARSAPARASEATFVIECEVECEGRAHRFSFDVTAPDEDLATDRALEMLERARVTGSRRKGA